jgi:glucose dehydrogenase
MWRMQSSQGETRGRRAWRDVIVVLGVAVGVVAPACSGTSRPDGGARDGAAASDAPAGAHESARFSPLAEIGPDNVGSLTVAWTYHSGDFAGGQGPSPTRQVAGVQVRPVVLGDLLIVTTPSSQVIALDGETGEERWRHDPQAGAPRRCHEPHRGVAVWPSAAHAPADAALADYTVFSGTCDGRLLALDAATGAPRAGFGDGGAVDLRPGVDARDGEGYHMTSPPAVYRDLVITGALVPEEVPTGPAGDIRAFDVRTGEERWRFHTVPRPGEHGHDTWPADGWQRRSGVNVWSFMSVDEERGLVFLPIGSPSYDFFGGDRPGQNLYGSSLVAVDAATGQRVWHQQLVHHDLWDFDPPSQPILAEITRDGARVPIVVQLTKMGLVFVFHRETGEPIFGIDERPVPASTLPGEQAWPTQPFPRKPAPLSRHAALTREELTTVPQSVEECTALFDMARSVGIYTPPAADVTLSFPGTMGGATWSGGAVEPRTGYLVVNTNEVGAIASMEPSPPGSVLPYRRTGPRGAYGRFWDKDELPCQQPPWGLLHAVDLNTGDIVWQVPLGEHPALAGSGITGTGTPNLGGAMVTASGLVFIGSSNDARFRAFELATGRLLWEAELPASGHAPPVSYRGARSGRQYVMIAAGGGGRFSRRISDAFVAFRLP